MTLSSLFANPFDPASSLQLNNRYWPGDTYQHLSLLMHCERNADLYGIHPQEGPFLALGTLFHTRRLYRAMLRRWAKLRAFPSTFTPLFCHVLTYAIERFLPEVSHHYQHEFGWDLTRVHRSVRHDVPTPDTIERMAHGPMSDYHHDERKGITGIVYLSTVTENDGPFSFIRGSESIPQSLLLKAIHQTVCFDMGLTKPEDMGHLPLEFRATPTLGNFLEPEKMEVLLQHEVRVTGGPGTAVLFNGQQLLHRGGKPSTGSRTAAFFAVEGVVRHKLRSAWAQMMLV